MAKTEIEKTNGGLPAFRVLGMNPEDVKLAISHNIGSGGLTEFDLPRIKVPSGGGTVWQVPTLGGEKNEEHITGIIVGFKDVRAFWVEDYETSGGGSPPECTSSDLVHGSGLFGARSAVNPSGLCSDCPNSKFGTAPAKKKPGSKTEEEGLGRGQACKQMRAMFLLRPDVLLPIVISAPPTSLKNAKGYFIGLASEGQPYWKVVTRLTLAKDKNKDGLQYSAINFALAGKDLATSLVPDKDLKAIAAYQAMINDALVHFKPSAEDRPTQS